jgi:hypothetical protein
MRENNNNTSLSIKGITYNKEEDNCSFSFSHDNESGIVRLRRVGFQSTIFNKCYYYGYEFDPDIDSSLRELFIKSIKFPDVSVSVKDKNAFIGNAVRNLDIDINLIKYDTLVYPQSMSELTRDMIKYLARWASPKYVCIELIKELPFKIEFDYERFSVEVLDSVLPSGKARYTEAQKKQVLSNIEDLMDNIHKSDYFSIARDIKKTKYRPYIKNYYKFKDEKDRDLFMCLENSNVLIVDDIATSGTTISHLLKTIRSLNDKNNITVFCLLGKNIEI